MLYRCMFALLLSTTVLAPALADDKATPSAPEATQVPAATGSLPASNTSTSAEAPPPKPIASEPAPVSSDPVAAKDDAAAVEPAPTSPEATQAAETTAAAPADATPAAPSTDATASAANGIAEETKPEAEAPSTTAAAAPGTAESGSLDAAPAEADPLTPAPDDTSPTRAPGAPTRAPKTQTVAEIDPFVLAVRTRLEAWPESRAKSDQEDLAALKAHYGETDAARIWTSTGGLTPRAEAALKAIERADDWGLDASAFDLPPRPASGAQAEALVDTEIRIGLEVLKYARYARGGRVNPASVSRVIDMHPRLYEPRSVIEAIAEAPAADAYLEGLHPKHKGFVALKEALAKLRQAPAEQAAESKAGTKRATTSEERRIVVNMERWRWLPDDLGEFYVWDNIPEQYTRVIHDGKVIHKAKIVVGKPSTPTPIFSMPMRFVIFHPTWGVPDGIKSNELAPMLRRAQSQSSGWFFSDNDGASRALRRHQLRIYSGGREINPDSINWSSTDIRRFSFVQPASTSNVLGVVKFRFPNKHDVYMHDTPERHLFSRKTRAFSHGCMRVEDPVKLAELILAYDKGWNRARINQILSRGATYDVTLEKKVNVHIAYFTATVDDSGKLHTFGDLYGLDSRLASALAGRSVVLSSARTDDGVEASAPRQTTRAASRTRRQATASNAPAPTPPRNWNAFNSTFGN